MTCMLNRAAVAVARNSVASARWATLGTLALPPSSVHYPLTVCRTLSDYEVTTKQLPKQTSASPLMRLAGNVCVRWFRSLVCWLLAGFLLSAVRTANAATSSLLLPLRPFGTRLSGRQ